MKFVDLIDKTILKAKRLKLKEHDDTGYLKLDFSDGTSCVIVSCFGGYTGNSEDEYPTGIFIGDKEIEEKLEEYDQTKMY